VNPQTIRTADYDLNGIGDLVGEPSISDNGTILSGTSSSGLTANQPSRLGRDGKPRIDP